MRLFKWIVPAVALALAVGLNVQADAEEVAAGTGTVTGVVYESDGATPVPDAKVVLRGKTAAKKSAKKADQLAEKAEKAPGAAELSATTDAAGRFSIEVPAGTYQVAVNVKGKGVARQAVTVAAGETANVTLTLVKKEGGPRKDGGAKKEKPDAAG